MSKQGSATTATTGGAAGARRALGVGSVARHAPSVAGYALPFLLVVYLALKGGGYDSVVRGEVGIAVWWLVLIGVVVGVLPATRVTRAGWLAIAAFGAFGLWTLLGVGWSESAERSVGEVARVSAYVGVFTLAVFAQGRDGLRRTVFAVAAAIGFVGLLAVVSRLQPDWFPPNETSRILEGTQARLSYPLNYWNGVATLMAIGIPLLLVCAERARHTVSTAISLAMIPLLSLAAFWTLSRGGAAEIAIGAVTLICLHPRRLALAPLLAVAAVGSAIVIAAAAQRDALESGLANASAAAQAGELAVLIVVVCLGVALLGAGVATAASHGLGPRIALSRRTTAIGWALALVAAVAIALVAGGAGYVAERWEEFKTPAPETSQAAARFESFSGSGRYEYWESALDASRAEPLLGIGPGTYEYWWARDEENNFGFARDAHSLYLETLAELGVIGLIALLGFLATILVVAGRRLLQSRDETRRALLAAATAGIVVFLVAAAVDWMWEIPVLPVAMLLLCAAVLGPSALPRAGRRDSRFAPMTKSVPVRAGLVVLSVFGLVAIAIPLSSDSAVQDSEAAVRGGAFPAALEDAGRAANIEPYAAAPELQRAMVLELEGDIAAAVQAAEQAAADEPTNWRNWLVLSRLEAKAGNVDGSLAAYRRARELNPNSVLLQPTPEG